MDKDYLIKKWLNDELTPEEQESFRQLDDAALNEEIIREAQRFKATHFSEPSAFEAVEAHLDAKKNNSKTRLWTGRLLKVAAVLAFCFMGYHLLNDTTNKHIETLVGEKKTILLPDNSQVVVNAVSSLRYNEDSWENKRQLKLNGEAFFEVVKGGQFDVETSSGLVSVVGTAFNVIQRTNFFEVSCFEGHVRVTYDGKVADVRAGDRFRVLDGTIEKGKTTDEFPQWTRNISTFSNVPILTVFEELERQYELEVIFQNMDVQELFSGGFEHNNIDNALISITAPLDLGYELTTEKKVLIYDKKR